MNDQKVFNKFGPNWKWASVSSNGSVRVHAVEPAVHKDGTLLYEKGSNKSARTEAFDIDLMPANAPAEIWERTKFDNGPFYDTDAFGMAIPSTPQQVEAPEAGFPLPSIPQPAAPKERPQVNRLENYPFHHTAHITQFADETFVWYDESGLQGGVCYSLEEAKKLVAEHAQHLNSPKAKEDTYYAQLIKEAIAHHDLNFSDRGAHHKGYANGLETALALIENRTPLYKYPVDLGAEKDEQLLKAKTHAYTLTQESNSDGSMQLTLVQYMAIFGERPQ